MLPRSAVYCEGAFHVSGYSYTQFGTYSNVQLSVWHSNVSSLHSCALRVTLKFSSLIGCVNFLYLTCGNCVISILYKNMQHLAHFTWCVQSTHITVLYVKCLRLGALSVQQDMSQTSTYSLMYCKDTCMWDTRLKNCIIPHNVPDKMQFCWGRSTVCFTAVQKT